MDVSKLRRDYTQGGLSREDLAESPFVQFQLWFQQAQEADLLEPNAMALATAGKDQQPSIRTVLLKAWDERGFVFYTNYESRKAQEISENPNASLLFMWLPLERQIKIQGAVEKISHADSLKYFISRPHGSQLGAWVSTQSKVISSRSILEAKLEEMMAKFREGEVPLPPAWGGYRVVPKVMEFWQGGSKRLHDRFEYSRQENNQWTLQRLAP